MYFHLNNRLSFKTQQRFKPKTSESTNYMFILNKDNDMIYMKNNKTQPQYQVFLSFLFLISMVSLFDSLIECQLIFTLKSIYYKSSVCPSMDIICHRFLRISINSRSLKTVIKYRFLSTSKKIEVVILITR
jgi:hypothetical protein